LSASALVIGQSLTVRPLPDSVPDQLGKAILGFERMQSNPAAAGMMDRSIAGWGFAVQWWLAVAPADPGAHLATGVLLECLAHRAGASLFTPIILPEANRVRCSWASSAECHREARRVYTRITARQTEKAVMAEIALRLARLESLDDPRRGYEALQEIATTSGDARLSYLARLFVGAAAEARREFDAAQDAYRGAMQFEPRWSSARFAAATLQVRAGEVPDEALIRSPADSSARDPYYGYSCTILTASVAAELESKQQRLFK
jgi:hypothetical protein